MRALACEHELAALARESVIAGPIQQRNAKLDRT